MEFKVFLSGEIYLEKIEMSTSSVSNAGNTRTR